MLFLTLLSLVGEAKAEDIPKNPQMGVEEGVLLQKVFPLLESRRLIAQAKIISIDSYFAGKSSFAVAFPFLADFSLHDPIVLAGLLADLQSRSDAREKERFAQENSKIDLQMRKEWQEELFSVLEIEAKADEKERRFLSALRVRLEMSAGLKDLNENKIFWEKERANVKKPVEGEGSEEYFLLMNEMSTQEKRFTALWQLIRDLGCQGGKPNLETFIAQELQFEIQTELEAIGVKGRLELLFPFVDEELGLRITEKKNQTQEFLFQQELLRQQEVLNNLNSEQIQVDFSSFSIQETEQEIVFLTENSEDFFGTEKTIISTKIQILKRRLELFSNSVNEAVKREEKVEEELNASRLKLEEAQRRREQEKEQKKQRILDEIISLRKIAEQLNSKESDRLKKAKEEKQEIQLTLQNIKDKKSKALSLPPLDSQKTILIDESYSTSHNLVRSLNNKIKDHSKASLAFQKEIENIKQQVAEYQKGQQSQEKQQAVEDIYSAIEFKRQHLNDELDELLSLLHDTKILRREVEPIASEKARELTNQDFWIQVQEEITVLPKYIEKEISDFAEWFDDFPKNIFGMRAISFSISFLFQSFIFILVWRLFRKNSNHLFAWILSFAKNFVWRKLSIQPRRIDLTSDGFVDISQRIVDILVVSWLSSLAYQSGFVVVSLILYGLVFYFSFRFVKRFVVLLLSTMQNASWVLDNESLTTKLIYAIRRFLIWWMFFNGIDTFLIHVLETDKLAEVFLLGQKIVFFLLLFYELRNWENSLSSLAKGQTDSGLLYRWLQSLPTNSVRSRLRSIISLCILFQSFTGWCISIMIEGSGWLGKTLAKRSLSTQENLNVPLLQAEKDEIFSGIEDDLDNQKEEKQLQRFFAAWSQDDSIGLAALIGYHGSGKSRFLDRLSDLLPISGPHKKLAVRKRLISERDALKWFCSGFNLNDSVDVREVINQLRQKERMLISIDDLHLGMIRDVGGYHALRMILSIMQATGNHHFWVASFHVYAWNFLNGEAIPVNLEVFRQKIEIKPLTSQELSHWFKTGVANLYNSISFKKLVSQGAHDKLIARAETAYWRLLADASGGNHSVAKHYLALSVHKGEEEGTLEMLMFDYHEDDSLEELLDVEVFVLTSLLIHDGLSLDLIQRTLNLSRQSVYSACRHLIGLNIIDREGELYNISRPWVPPVERFLNRRRLLFLDT